MKIIIITVIKITVIVTRQVLGRPVCDRGAIPRTLVQWNVVRSRLIRDRFSVALYATRSDPPKMKNSNVVRSRLIILINKQHTQFGVSASNGSRDMARTKSWRKKKNK